METNSNQRILDIKAHPREQNEKSQSTPNMTGTKDLSFRNLAYETVMTDFNISFFKICPNRHLLRIWKLAF